MTALPKPTEPAPSAVESFLARWRSETEQMIEMYPDNPDLKAILQRIDELEKEARGETRS